MGHGLFECAIHAVPVFQIEVLRNIYEPDSMEYVIIDRSILHRDKFAALRDSPLPVLIRQNALRIYFTPSFIEETLHFGLRRREELRSQLDFLYAINSTHWFRGADGIIDAELGSNWAHPLYYLLTDDEILRIKSGSEDYTEQRIGAGEIAGVIEEVERNSEIRERFRLERLSMRHKVPISGYEFDPNFERNVEWLLRNGVMAYHENSNDFLKRWTESRTSCPFTEAYLKCWFATMFLPIVDHELRVDKNDPSDATQLAYLTWADIIVSDDQRFMKAAFDLLYADKGKKFLTHRGFREYLDQLVAGQ